MVLKAKYFSCLCAERYPKENYAKEVNKALGKIEKFEPVVLKELSANPLWGYNNVLQRQADWISVNEAIIRECDERETTVNIKLQKLDDKFTKEYLELREKIQRERKDREAAISRLKESIGQIAARATRRESASPSFITGGAGYFGI